MRWNWDGTRRVLRSAPARAKLRWPDWHQRRAATRASFVCGVLEKGAPPSLCGLVPPPEESHTQRRAKAQAELRIASQHPARRVGDKGFRTWAPWQPSLPPTATNAPATAAEAHAPDAYGTDSEAEAAASEAEAAAAGAAGQAAAAAAAGSDAAASSSEHGDALACDDD
eukprot:gene7854-6824_t